VEQIERISHRLKFQHLNLLRTVAQTGSMAKAAKQLSISQPVVSKSIAELEDMLGVRLFDRSPQGVELTPYGRVFVKHSMAIFDDLRTSVGEIGFLADPTAGELRIGSTETQAGLVATVIERLSRQYPRINFKAVLADTMTLIDRELRGRLIDLMVGPLLKPSLAEDLQATFLYENCMRVVVGTQSRWARRRKVTLADLIDEPWCGPPIETAPGAMFADAFRASGLPLPRIAVSSFHGQLLRRLLADGRFVGVTSDGEIRFSPEAHSLKILPIQMPGSPVAVITLKGRTVSPVAQLFVDRACEIARPLS
jgi:DNA-binding transcriptional LysR family regulator